MLHRVVLGVDGIPATAILADHVDGNTLDCRRANLRLATPSQNAMNRKLRSDNKSGARGVTWDAKHHKWEVRVKVAGKQKFGGRFSRIESAEKAARELREQLHGRFARHD
jgi:hypothetical protein